MHCNLRKKRIAPNNSVINCQCSLFSFYSTFTEGPEAPKPVEMSPIKMADSSYMKKQPSVLQNKKSLSRSSCFHKKNDQLEESAKRNKNKVKISGFAGIDESFDEKKMMDETDVVKKKGSGRNKINGDEGVKVERREREGKKKTSQKKDMGIFSVIHAKSFKQMEVRNVSSVCSKESESHQSMVQSPTRYSDHLQSLHNLYHTIKSLKQRDN